LNVSSRARSRRLIAASTLGVIALATVLVGCSSTSGASVNKGTLVLYNAQHEQTTQALVDAFTRQTGIQVKIDNDDEDVLTAKIEQEGTRSPADVFFTENSNWLQQLADRKLLSTVKKSTLADVPAADNAKDGDWVAISARVSALVYNTSKLTEADMPTSVLDLADPKWKGKIEIAPAETDFWPIISSVDHTYGDAKTLAWLEGLKANAGANGIVPDNETLVADVNTGTTELGLINHYYFDRLRGEKGESAIHSALSYLAPQDPGYLETFSAAGILKSSKHQAEAQKFLAFLTSKAGQEALAKSDSFEYPLAAGVSANKAVTPLSQLHPSTTFTPELFGTGADAKRLLQKAQLL
jgi:iron(III) transport system substrate-binding protein